jgi:hypothetical protein
MNTLTRTMTLIRSGHLRASLAQRLQDWREQILAESVAWLLSHRAVQHKVADVFSSNTPMCRVLSDAIESYNRQVELDDIHGFDRALEEAITSCFENFDVSEAKGFEETVERAVDQAFSDERFREEITSAVVEEIVGRLRG